MHTHPIRVYYEDTDLAGIVYYANYLKFIERARTEAVTEAGIDQPRLKQDQGIVFAVRRIEADYLSPAKFSDDLTVTTEITRLSGASIVMDQRVWRGEAELFRAQVKLVALTAEGRAARLPAEIRRKLAPLVAGD